MELKTPPHSLEAEQHILGGVLVRPDSLVDVLGLVNARMFYRKEHRLIWEAVEQLQQTGKAVDAVTVHEVLRASGKAQDAGGQDYIMELVQAGFSGYNLPAYAEIIRDRAIERHLISVGHGIADNGYNGTEPVQEKVAKAQSALINLPSARTKETVRSITDSLKGAVNDLSERFDKGGGMMGLSTGYKDLDLKTGGLKPGEFILLAARPAQGKSTLSQNIMENLTLAGKSVLFFSVEMPEKMVTMRHLASVGRVPLAGITEARLTDDEFDRVSSAVMKMKDRFYHIDDDPNLTSIEILPRAQRHIIKTGRPLDLVVVDYLQKLRDKGENQNNRVGEISSNVKHAARALNCPIIGISQLSREVEKRPNKRPILSDLRDSGSLEQDADMAIFIYRDEVYNDASEMAGIAEILIRKNRNGQTGDVWLTSRLDLARFENFSGMIPMKGGRQRGGLD